MKRKTISKKFRFEVFKRDSFACQYCGNTPPGAVLNIDHINPVSKGGTNDIDNLLTACFSCNSGKSNVDLKVAPSTVVEKAAAIKEKEEQLREFNKIVKRKKARIEKEINSIEAVMQEIYPEVSFSLNGRTSIKKYFLTYFDVETVKEYMELACLRVPHNPDATFKYFCGICWTAIREEGN